MHGCGAVQSSDPAMKSVSGAADAYLAGIDAALRNGHNGLAADYETAIEALS